MGILYCQRKIISRNKMILQWCSNLTGRHKYSFIQRSIILTKYILFEPQTIHFLAGKVLSDRLHVLEVLWQDMTHHLLQTEDDWLCIYSKIHIQKMALRFHFSFSLCISGISLWSSNFLFHLFSPDALLAEEESAMLYYQLHCLVHWHT